MSNFLNQVTMPWLTDERCKQKYPTSNPVVHICAGETGGLKDTCQVSKINFNHSELFNFKIFLG